MSLISLCSDGIEDRYRLEDHHIPVEGTNMHVRTYTPTSNPDKTKTYPLLYWVHCGVRLFFRPFEKRETRSDRTDRAGLLDTAKWTTTT